MSLFVPVLIMGGISLLLALVLVASERFLAEYGPCRITINGGRSIEVQGGETLLYSLFSQRIFIPSACGGKGSCGYCKVRVLEGGGPLMPTERPYLTPQEIASGFRLACQLKVKGDIEVEIPEEYLAIREYTAVVLYSRRLTYDMKEVRFRLLKPKEIIFKPGQHIQMHVPVEGGRTVYRAYSISSTPSTPGEIELIVRLIPGGMGSTYIHNLREGDEVVFSGPYGEFFLREDPGFDVLCVGGGSGMAPLKSIIYSLFEKGTKRKVYLFFGVRAKKDLFYLEEFEKLAREHPNFRYTYALSSPEEADEWEGEKGFIHLVLDRRLDSADGMEAYLCGPPPMIDAVIKVLLEKGIDGSRIYFDKF